MSDEIGLFEAIHTQRALRPGTGGGSQAPNGHDSNDTQK
jgi:hypothetical protein